MGDHIDELMRDENAGELAVQLRLARAHIEALERVLAHNIRDRVIDMIDQGYRTPEMQQPFFPDVDHHILAMAFAEPLIAVLALRKADSG